jgi:phosphoglycolate phosphatase
MLEWCSMTGAVLFDLDGVLVDSRVAIGASMNHALVSRGHAAREETLLHRYIGPPLLEAFSELTGEPVGSPEVAALVTAYRERYAVASLRDSLINPGIEAALEALGGEYTLAVATSKPRAFAVPLLDVLGLSRHFAWIAGPELDSTMETKAETVRGALERVGGPPAVMVGDRSHDIEGARANGIPVVGVKWGIGTADELADADALVEAPRELPAVVARLLNGWSAAPPAGP